MLYKIIFPEVGCTHSAIDDKEAIEILNYHLYLNITLEGLSQRMLRVKELDITTPDNTGDGKRVVATVERYIN